MLRLMVYDEGGSIQEMLHGVLEYKDYGVVCPVDVDDACASAKKGWVDAILVEIPAQEEDQVLCRTLLRIGRLKDAAGRVPIILVTDRPELGEEEAREAGFSGLLRPPIDLGDLEIRLRLAMEEPVMEHASLAA